MGAVLVRAGSTMVMLPFLWPRREQRMSLPH